MDDENTSFSPADIAGAFAGADFGTPAETVVEEEAPDLTDDAPTQEDEESSADDDQAGEDEDEAAPEPEDDGPGNRKAALKAEREKNKALKAESADLQRRLQAIENERAQERHQRHQQEAKAHREAILDQMHPDDIPAYLEQESQQQAQALQRQTQERAAWQRLSDSADAARAALGPEFDTQLSKLTSVFGNDLVNYWAMGQEKPALAVFNAAKGLYTQADIDAAKEEGRKAALEGLPGRPLRKQPSAPSLRNIPSSGRATDVSQEQRLSKQLAKGDDTETAVRGLFGAVNWS